MIMILCLLVVGVVTADAQKIIDSDVTYYISDQKEKNLTGFAEIKEIDGLYLYKRNA